MNILYIMHVEWGWIKQRPHFIAEELNKNHKLRVLTEVAYRNKSITENASPVSRGILLNVPLRGRFKLLRRLDIVLNRSLIKFMCIFNKYDLVWVTHPSHFFYVQSLNVPIIYDCMDDHASFDINDQSKSLKNIEKNMFNLAWHTIFSSSRLQEINKERVSNSTVVKNGISSSIIIRDGKNALQSLSSREASMIYFGTISSWFDFEVIKYLINHCPDLVIKLIGPIEININYKHERLIYLGVMDHGSLMQYCNEVDYFIMPFIVNELILNVDPVKIYEYIALGKPIVSVYYSGLSDFAPFVNFYKNSEDLYLICEKINSNKLSAANLDRRIEFLSDSTWKARSTIIESILIDKKEKEI